MAVCCCTSIAGAAVRSAWSTAKKGYPTLSTHPGKRSLLGRKEHIANSRVDMGFPRLVAVHAWMIGPSQGSGRTFGRRNTSPVVIDLG